MDKGLYFTTSKMQKKKEIGFDEVDDKIEDGNSTLTKAWEGWETELV
jgi:hypothetical protein